MNKRRAHILTTSAALAAGVCFAALLPAHPAYANPQGGVVVSGAATITESGNKLDVHQSTNRALIDWRSFDIAPDEHTQFHQPSSNAVAVNRILDTNPSTIAGRLTANGNIVLVNPNGMMFTNTAVVDVNGLVATTANIANADFEAGSLFFDQHGAADAKIENHGLITAQEAGLVGLVAPQVENHGVIQARLGRVQLASADVATLDFYGDGLLKVAVADSALVKQFVHNTGTLVAEGGVVAMTAATARHVVDSLIKAEGELYAPTVAEQGGRIVIQNANEGGKVTVQATLDASGRDVVNGVGEQGGQIEILGGDIALLDGTLLDASGHSAPNVDVATSATMTDDGQVRSEADFLAHQNRAGGSIKVGGDYLGQGETQTAQTLRVDSLVLTLNDALESGDAGRTIFWSDGTTTFNGFVFARGGVNAGHGGFVETSGKEVLDVYGYVDLRSRAEAYRNGTYFLDPSNIAIYGNVDGQFTSTDGAVDLTNGQVLHLRSDVEAPDASDVFTGVASPNSSFTTGVIANGSVNTSSYAVFTVDINIPASPRGVIYEQGGSGVGTYVGFQSDGTLVFHAGDGGSFSEPNAAHLELTPGTLTGSGTLSWEIDIGANKITAYWNGVEVGSDVAATAFSSWSGGNDGGFGQVTSAIVAGADTNNFNGSFSSNLKYYNNGAGDFLNDESGSGNHASITVGGPSIVAGALNGRDAIVMDDSDQFEIADTNDINTADNSGLGRAFTFKTDSDVTTQQILFKEGGGTNGYVVYLENGKLNVGLYNSNNREWRQFDVTGDTAYQLSSSFDAANDRYVVSLNGVEQDGEGLGVGVDFAAHSGDITFGRSDGAIRDETGSDFTPTNTISTLGETMFHNVALDDEVRHVIDQYGAAKFGIGLEGLGTGANEVERATAADGYSVFTTRYLEHLSSMADVDLLASNNITLDLQGDTLTMDTGRSLSLTATGGQISELSAGAIVTNNGDISLNAGTDITLTQTSLQAGGNGKVNFNAGGDVTLTQAEALRLGTGVANTAFIRTTGANDITLVGRTAVTGAGNALTLVSGDDLINLRGTDALGAANGRWLVYSNDPVENTEGGLKPKFRKFDAPYATNMPAGLTELGNGFVYVTSVIPPYLQTVRNLPDTVTQVMQMPTLQAAPFQTAPAGLEGEIFEVSEPLRLQLEASFIQDRAASHVGTIRLDPALMRAFKL